MMTTRTIGLLTITDEYQYQPGGGYTVFIRRFSAPDGHVLVITRQDYDPDPYAFRDPSAGLSWQIDGLPASLDDAQEFLDFWRLPRIMTGGFTFLARPPDLRLAYFGV